DMWVARINELLDDWEAGELVVVVVMTIGMIRLDVGEVMTDLVDGLVGEGEVGVVTDSLT
ncbi:hypothetical protein KI387_000132, partial [Taxus chinensis]